jgi:hypothetical protein
VVVGWTGLFAAHIVSANANFLPGWFTGTAFNFPLNLVTTVAELFIGFLVAAAANRSERNLELTLAAIAEQEEHIEDVQAKLSEELASNTALTQQIHEMASEIHTLLKKLVGYHSHEFSRVTKRHPAVGGPSVLIGPVPPHVRRGLRYARPYPGKTPAGDGSSISARMAVRVSGH